MCKSASFLSARCGHLIHKSRFHVEVCAHYVASRDTLKYECKAEEHTQRISVDQVCYYCWDKNGVDGRYEPLSNDILKKIEGDVDLEQWTWYVARVAATMPEGEPWKDNDQTLSEDAMSNASTPETLPLPIPSRSPLRAKSCNIFGTKKLPFTPTGKLGISSTDSSPRQKLMKKISTQLPTPPKSRIPTRTSIKTSVKAPMQTPAKVKPQIPARHAKKVLIIPHTGLVTHVRSPSPAIPRRIPAHKTTLPLVTTPQAPTLTLDATDPLLTSSLRRGDIAQSSRAQIRSIRASSRPKYRPTSPLQPSSDPIISTDSEEIRKEAILANEALLGPTEIYPKQAPQNPATFAAAVPRNRAERFFDEMAKSASRSPQTFARARIVAEARERLEGTGSLRSARFSPGFSFRASGDQPKSR